MGCPETSVTNYQSALRNVLEERRSHLHRDFWCMFLFIISPSRWSIVFCVSSSCLNISTMGCRLRLKCDGTRAETKFRRNGRVHLNRQGYQFIRLLAAEVCASASVMLDTPCSEVVWRVLATHSIRQFLLHLPSLRSGVPSHFNWTLHAG